MLTFRNTEKTSKDEMYDSVLKHPFILTLYIIFSFIIVNLLVMTMFVNNYKENVVKEITKNIHEYDEVDLSHLCAMYDCKYISNDEILYENENHKISQYARLNVSKEILSKQYEVFDKLHLTQSFDILIEVQVPDYFDGFIVVVKTTLFDIINNVYYYMLVLFITFNLILLIYNILSYKNFQMKINIMLQHEGYYKSIMMLTENIHHELNTPLSVIYNRINKIREQFYENCESCDTTSPINKDFEIIDSSLHQIADLLVRMRPFKDLKRNRSRDIKTLLKTACDMVNVSQHDKIDYEIDYDFNNYKIDTKNLKVGEFTAIMLNFIKNSVDAHASDMKFKIKHFDRTTKKLSMYIIDNGNGIPENLHQHIFKEDTSTKSSSRGNGLFINKFILNSSNGDILLATSSKNGTVFELTIPATEIIIK